MMKIIFGVFVLAIIASSAFLLSVDDAPILGVSYIPPSFISSSSQPTGYVLTTSNTSPSWQSPSSLLFGTTEGSVLFSSTSGAIAEDNDNFFWDDTNNRLGIGTSTPQAALHVVGSSTIDGNILIPTGNYIQLGDSSVRLGQDANFEGGFFLGGATASPSATRYIAASSSLQFYANAGVAGGGNYDVWFKLTGANGRIDFESLTSTGFAEFRVDVIDGFELYQGTGEFEIFTGNVGSSALRFIIDSNGRIGIGTSTPATTLQVIDTASTTITIGSPTLTGCITMGDTDSGGVTYLTVLNGVLSATTTKPSTCQ